MLDATFQREKTAELANLLHPQATDHGPDALDRFVAAINADPGLLVGAFFHP